MLIWKGKINTLGPTQTQGRTSSTTDYKLNRSAQEAASIDLFILQPQQEILQLYAKLHIIIGQHKPPKHVSAGGKST